MVLVAVENRAEGNADTRLDPKTREALIVGSAD